MSFKTTEVSDGKVVVIECPDRVDSSVANDLRTIMKESTEQDKFMIVVDMDKTEFMDSSGLGALVSRIAATRSNSGDIRIACIKEPIMNLFELTHLDKIFQCFKSVQSAVDSFDR
ncbi:MAG: STAS domain-containing protein [Thermodesulfobacteriota bacterium]|nr:STAS domain-containing protein [Thermodesulfobacteriota bacterium]